MNALSLFSLTAGYEMEATLFGLIGIAVFVFLVTLNWSAGYWFATEEFPGFCVPFLLASGCAAAVWTAWLILLILARTY